MLRHLPALWIAPFLFAHAEPAFAFASPCPAYEEHWTADPNLDKPTANFKDFLEQLRSADRSAAKNDLEKIPALGQKCVVVVACYGNNKFRLGQLGHSFEGKQGAGTVPATSEAKDLLSKLERDKTRYENCEELRKAAQKEVDSVSAWQSVLNGFRTRR